MMIEKDSELKQAFAPLNLIWIALPIGVAVMNFVALKKINFEFSFNPAIFQNVLYLSTYFAFIFVYLFHSKRHRFIKESNTQKVPYFVTFDEPNKTNLRFMPKYMSIHIIMWVISESAVVFALMFTFLTKDYSYMLCSSIVFFILHFIILRPDYLSFLDEKNRGL